MIDTLTLKIAAAAVFILAGTAGGRFQAGRLKERVKLLEELIGGMRLFQSEIYYTHERLENISKRLVISCRGCASDLFFQFSEELKRGEGRDTEEIWNSAAGKLFQMHTALRTPDLNTLKTAGIRLGRDDIGGQCAYIGKTAEELQVRLQEARQDSETRSRLFQTLGTAAGCAGALLIM